MRGLFRLYRHMQRECHKIQIHMEKESGCRDARQWQRPSGCLRQCRQPLRRKRQRCRQTGIPRILGNSRCRRFDESPGQESGRRPGCYRREENPDAENAAEAGRITEPQTFQPTLYRVSALCIRLPESGPAAFRLSDDPYAA